MLTYFDKFSDLLFAPNNGGELYYLLLKKLKEKF